KIFRPRARKMSTMPAASGASGPTTVNATCSRSASAARVCGSLTGILRTPGSRAVPPLPGATMTCWTLGERARHQASACSRPPEPTTRIFMRVPSFGFLVLEHGVRVHLLGVVELLEGVDQLLDALAVLGVQLDLDVGTHRDLGDLGLEPGRLEAALEGPEIGRRAEDLDPALVVRGDVLRARLDGGFHHRVLGGAGSEQELAAVRELERDRAVGAEVPVVLGEGMADLGDGAGAVVGQAVDDHRGAAGAVAFVADFLVGRAVELTRATLDGAPDGVLGHVGVGRLVHGEPQPRVRLRVGPAPLRGDGQLPDDPRENLAALGVGPLLLVLDVGPFGMTRHRLLYLALHRGRAIIHPAEQFRFYHPGSPRARPPAPFSIG